MALEAPTPNRRIAIAHDWLMGRRGGEKVLEEMLAVLPGADVLTLVHVPGRVPLVEERAGRIVASWLSRLPGVRRYFQALLPVFNGIGRGMRLDGYDLVVSCSHCWAKNVVPPVGVPHLCYCHTPMRYAWDLFDLYTERYLSRGAGRFARLGAVRLRERLRREDREGSATVTRFLCNSGFVRDRIRRCYDRDATVLYPPVDTAAFSEAGEREQPGDRFLVISAICHNKRVEEIVRAFAQLGLPLDVVGAGRRGALERLQEIGGEGVRLCGEVSQEELLGLVGRCRAIVHAATEDFGIVPVEAMAAGRPAIGYRHCGLAESIVDDDAGRTGVLFDEPTPEGIAAGVRRFLELEPRLDPAECRRRAELFSAERFREGLAREVGAVAGERCDRATGRAWRPSTGSGRTGSLLDLSEPASARAEQICDCRR